MYRGNRYRKLAKIPLLVYKLLVFFVEIMILLICITFAQMIYTNNILPDKLVKENFSETACTVAAKTLSEKGKLVHRYRADFLVNYALNNIPYRAWVTGNGLDQAFFHDREPQEAILAQFEVGQVYPCWYNPLMPQMVVLVLRHDWASTLPLAIPATISLIMIYYLLKTSFQLLDLLYGFVQSRGFTQGRKKGKK